MSDKEIISKMRGFTPVFDGLVMELGGTEALVFGKIWRYCQMADGVCYASQERIAQELNMSRRTVMRCISTLVEHGYLIDKTPDLVGSTHTYADTGRAGFNVVIEGVTKSHSTSDKMSQVPVPKCHSKKVLKKVNKDSSNTLGKPSLLVDPQPQQQPQNPNPTPNIYSIYQSNIGPLTPMLAEHLAEYEKLPTDIIQRAFSEAVNNNVRKWSYIKAILDNWQRNGYSVPKSKSEMNYPAVEALDDNTTTKEEKSEWSRKMKAKLENLRS